MLRTDPLQRRQKILQLFPGKLRRSPWRLIRVLSAVQYPIKKHTIQQ